MRLNTGLPKGKNNVHKNKKIYILYFLFIKMPLYLQVGNYTFNLKKINYFNYLIYF